MSRKFKYWVQETIPMMFSDSEHLILCIQTVHMWLHLLGQVWLCFGFSPHHSAVLVYVACPPVLEIRKTQSLGQNDPKHASILLTNYEMSASFYTCLQFSFLKKVILCWCCTEVISVTDPVIRNTDPHLQSSHGVLYILLLLLCTMISV